MCLALGLLFKDKPDKGSGAALAPRPVASHSAPTAAHTPQPYKQ